MRAPFALALLALACTAAVRAHDEDGQCAVCMADCLALEHGAHPMHCSYCAGKCHDACDDEEAIVEAGTAAGCRWDEDHWDEDDEDDEEAECERLRTRGKGGRLLKGGRGKQGDEHGEHGEHGDDDYCECVRRRVLKGGRGEHGDEHGEHGDDECGMKKKGASILIIIALAVLLVAALVWGYRRRGSAAAAASVRPTPPIQHGWGNTIIMQAPRVQQPAPAQSDPSLAKARQNEGPGLPLGTPLQGLVQGQIVAHHQALPGAQPASHVIQPVQILGPVSHV